MELVWGRRLTSFEPLVRATRPRTGAVLWRLGRACRGQGLRGAVTVVSFVVLIKHHLEFSLLRWRGSKLSASHSSGPMQVGGLRPHSKPSFRSSGEPSARFLQPLFLVATLPDAASIGLPIWFAGHRKLSRHRSREPGPGPTCGRSCGEAKRKRGAISVPFFHFKASVFFSLFAEEKPPLEGSRPLESVFLFDPGP